MNKAIERQINNIYNTVYKEVFNKSANISLSKGNRTSIELKLTSLQSSNKYNEFAKKFALALAKKGLNNQKGIWRKYYEASKKSGKFNIPINYRQFQFSVLNKAIRHNFEMIKSIPTKMMEILNHKYTSTLIEEVVKGTLPRGSFAKELAKHGHKQAKLIARTETAKLQTAITRNRALDIGSVAYIWISSKDKRTRPSHKAMDGVIVFWRPDSQKPLLDNMKGDAGEFPNCRCDAQPIVDINDLTKSTYKVYDYRQHKIIVLKRVDLIKALEKGEL